MAPYEDYANLPRRELQALCKQHKIPANKTNVFMAEALDALLNNAPRQQVEFQEEEIPAPDSPEVEKVVEKVKGKRIPKKALLAEPELDSLADLLANSSLNSSVHGEMTEQAVVPEKILEESVPSENMLHLAPMAVAPKSRRGRPRLTKNEGKAVDAPTAEAAATDENMGVSNTELAEEVTMKEVEGSPKTWAEAALEAGALHLGAVPAYEEPQAQEKSPVYIQTETLTEFEVPAGMVENVAPISTSFSAKVELEREMYIAEPALKEVLPSLPAVPAPIEEKKSRKTKKAGSKSHRNAEVEVEYVEHKSSFLTAEVEPEREVSIAKPVTKEVEATVPFPMEEKKRRKSRKTGSKSRRNAEVEVEDVLELPAAMIEEDVPITTSVSAEFEPRREGFVVKPNAEGTVETLLAPGEKKSRKPKKAGPKSCRHAGVEAEAEVEVPTEMCDQVVPDVGSFTMAVLADLRIGGAVAENHFNSPTFPSSILEEKLPSLKQNSFTISPSVPREKPKARKTKKASTKPLKNAEQAAVEDVCESTAEEPLVVDTDVRVASNRDAGALVSDMESEKENVQEPITPVKMGAYGPGDDKENENDTLLSLSMRKLRKKCKEKGLQTRGANNTRSMKL